MASPRRIFVEAVWIPKGSTTCREDQRQCSKGSAHPLRCTVLVNQMLCATHASAAQTWAKSLAFTAASNMEKCLCRRTTDGPQMRIPRHGAVRCFDTLALIVLGKTATKDCVRQTRERGRQKCFERARVRVHMVGHLCFQLLQTPKDGMSPVRCTSSVVSKIHSLKLLLADHVPIALRLSPHGAIAAIQ